MTSLAFILGVLPLAFSSGAGAGARISAGTGVMGGMLAATFLAIFFVPIFFKLITDRHLTEKRSSDEIKREAETARNVHAPAGADAAPRAARGGGRMKRLCLLAGVGAGGLRQPAEIRPAGGRAAGGVEADRAALRRGRPLVAHLRRRGAGEGGRRGAQGQRRPADRRGARRRGARAARRGQFVLLAERRCPGRRQPPAGLDAHRDFVSGHPARVQQPSRDAQRVVRARSLRPPARQFGRGAARARGERSVARSGAPRARRPGHQVVLRAARARRAGRR